MVYTDYRPTPLQHFVFPTGGDGLFMVVDDRGTFREDNFQKAVAALADTTADGGAPLTWCIFHADYTQLKGHKYFDGLLASPSGVAAHNDPFSVI